MIETTAVDPPWIPLQGNAGAPRSHWYFHPFARDLVEPERPESLRPFHASVPWVRPLHPRSPTSLLGSRLALGSIGLEWCGLRVGYADELEAPEPDAAGCPWWPFVREVGASRVGVRGESDHFLFYDGVVNLPGPVHVSWSRAARDELVLGARSFQGYPELPPELLDAWWLSDAEKTRLRTALPIPCVFVIDKQDGQPARGTVLERLDPEEPPRQIRLAELDLPGAQLVERFEAALRAQGLDEAEARSLVRTWHRDFFELSGLRTVTVMPQWLYDVLLPAKVFPLPDSFARVGLVQRELKDLEVGTASWGLEDPGARWTPRPWTMPREKRALEWKPFSPGEERPLELPDDGGLVLESGQPCALALSADGSKLAFATRDGSIHELWLADLGSRRRRLVERLESVNLRIEQPLLVDDAGARLVYTVEVGPGPGKNNTFVADLRAGRRLDLGQVSATGIAADGRRLLVGRMKGAGLDRQVIDLDLGETTTVLTMDIEHTFSQSASLSGDGRRVAFDCQERVFVADLEDGMIFDLSGPGGRDIHPAISHDGTKVVFESQRRRDTDLYLADLTSRRFARCTERIDDQRLAQFFAGGQELLYREWEAGTFVACNLATGEKTPVDDTERVWIVAASNTRRVAFIRRRGETAAIIVRDL